jgi:hypothetical protein
MPIQRFKYSDVMVGLLDNFARIHRYDDRIDFRKFWDVFVETNRKTFEYEVKLLYSRGFKSDPHFAMYKSTRFYYRKRYIENNAENIKKNTKKHSYSKFPSKLIELIDSVIEKYISTNIKQVTEREYICTITPASCYINFCDDYEFDLSIHIGDYVRQTLAVGGDISSILISNKLKKTFKNRFYKIQEKLKIKP